MPGFVLRLTDVQHAQLALWARTGGRSMQKEIIRRLFENDQLNLVTQVAAPEASLTPSEESAHPADTGAAAPCGYANRHHLYGPSSPCPRCGYPNA